MVTATDKDWPPGTVKLQALLKNETASDETQIILQPRPSDDPNDPLNWPKWHKSLNFGLSCFYAMMVFAFVNATSPTWGPLADQLGFSDATLLDTYAIGKLACCATLAVGAPMLIPFALKFGSRPVYLFSSLFQFVISVWAARTETAGDWWGVNALQCWLGSLAEVLVQITIADVFFVHQRGTMNSIYIWVANVGQNLAIVAAGYITLDQGWRWVWWWCAIFFGLQLIMFIFGFEETKYMSDQTIAGRDGERDEDLYQRTMSEKRGEDMPPPTDSPKQTKEVVVHDTTDQAALKRMGTIHIDSTLVRKPYWKRLNLFTISHGPWSHAFRHSWQPFLILTTIPGVSFVALVYGILTALTTVQTSALSLYMLLPPYNFVSAQIGLMSLAPFVGGSLGSLICGPLSDWLVLRLAKRNNGVYEPEMRFWVFLPFIPFMLGGSWWFAYAMAEGRPWPQVAVGYAVCWFGIAPLQAVALTYMLDAYNEIVGDALTAVTSVRNLVSTIFVFSLDPWIDGVGVPNVFNTINALALLFLSFGAVFIWKGKEFRWRCATRYATYASHQYEARPII